MDVEALAAAIQNSAFAALVRNSTFIYPIANIVHVVGLVGFFGLVATMDLRLLRVFKGMPAAELIAKLRPYTFALLLLVIVAGIILYVADAIAISQNPAFRLKLLAIILAFINIGVNAWSLRTHGEASWLVALTAGFSLFVWLLVATLGRSIAYV
jgi:hypothetical protein